MSVHETAAIGLPAQWRGKDPGLATWFTPSIAPTAKIGAYTVIDAGCERATVIGAHTWVMAQCHVGHGVWIGENCEIASGTVIAGEAEIGDEVRVGIGALILPFVSIGRGARIGAGAVVTKHVLAFSCVAGNPARHLYWLCRGGCFKRVEAQGDRCPGCTHAPVGTYGPAMRAVVDPAALDLDELLAPNDDEQRELERDWATETLAWSGATA